MPPVARAGDVPARPALPEPLVASRRVGRATVVAVAAALAALPPLLPLPLLPLPPPWPPEPEPEPDRRQDKLPGSVLLVPPSALRLRRPRRCLLPPPDVAAVRTVALAVVLGSAPRCPCRPGRSADVATITTRQHCRPPSRTSLGTLARRIGWLRARRPRRIAFAPSHPPPPPAGNRPVVVVEASEGPGARQRVVQAIAVAVEALQVVRMGDHRIGLQEDAQCRESKRRPFMCTSPTSSRPSWPVKPREPCRHCCSGSSRRSADRWRRSFRWRTCACRTGRRRSAPVTLPRWSRRRRQAAQVILVPVLHLHERERQHVRVAAGAVPTGSGERAGRHQHADDLPGRRQEMAVVVQAPDWSCC